jgi:hypothetical protein
MTNKDMMEAMGVCVIPVGFYDFACEIDEEAFEKEGK